MNSGRASNEEVAGNQRDMSRSSLPGPTVEWSRRPEFAQFGDRLNFLSQEKQHLETGKLRILPPRMEKRNGRAS